MPTCNYLVHLLLRVGFLSSQRPQEECFQERNQSFPFCCLFASFDNVDIQAHDKGAGSKREGCYWCSWPGLKIRELLELSSWTVQSKRKSWEPESARYIGKYTTLYDWDWVIGLNLKPVSVLSSGLQQSWDSNWSDKAKRTCKLG